MSSARPLATIDWLALRHRVEDAGAGVDAAPDCAHVRRILRERARRLAGEERAVDPTADELTLLELRLARERWALDASIVRRVDRLAGLAPLPSPFPVIRGLVTIRGELLPVIDLALVVGLPPCGLTDLNHLVVLGGAAVRLVVLVDEVVGLRRVARADLRPAPESFALARPELVLGITPDRTAVLDLEQLLADPGCLLRTAASD